MPTKSKATDMDIITNEDVQPEPTESEVTSEAEANTEPEVYPAVTFGPDNGGDIVLNAWQGLYWVFGARAERFDLTDDGVYSVGITMAPGFNPATVVADMGGGKRHPRLDLYPLYQYVMGVEPEEFEGDDASLELTRWLTANFRNEDGGRSPDYAKKAIADYKKARNLDKPRGRKPRKILEQLASIDPKVLAGMDPDGLAKLREILAQAETIQHETATEAATATS